MRKHKPILFINLQTQNQTIRRELMDAVARVMDSSSFAGSTTVESFEKRFARFCGCPYAVSCSSGSTALQLALLSLGIGPLDEVITTPFTFVATVEAIVHAGAQPVFADIDPRTYTLSPYAVERAITPKTRAILAVHLYGHPCDLASLRSLADRHNLFLIEDCAQAHGARYQNKIVGSWGDVGCFSFYPTKNLGAWGEAGALVTHRSDVAQKARSLANHGRKDHQVFEHVGFNFRMDGLQAALLEVKLKYLSAWNRKRRQLAAQYRRKLKTAQDIVLPFVDHAAQHVYHLFVIQTPQRDQLAKRLQQAGIGCAVHYRFPVHMQAAYSFLGYHAGDFPVAEALSQKVLSLPFYPELKPAEIDAVAHILCQT